MSPQKPLDRFYQRDEEKVVAWKEKAYLEIKKMTKKEKATIYSGFVLKDTIISCLCQVLFTPILPVYLGNEMKINDI